MFEFMWRFSFLVLSFPLLQACVLGAPGPLTKVPNPYFERVVAGYQMMTDKVVVVSLLSEGEISPTPEVIRDQFKMNLEKCGYEATSRLKTFNYAKPASRAAKYPIEEAVADAEYQKGDVIIVVREHDRFIYPQFDKYKDGMRGYVIRFYDTEMDKTVWVMSMYIAGTRGIMDIPIPNDEKATIVGDKAMKLLTQVGFLPKCMVAKAF